MPPRKKPQTSQPSTVSQDDASVLGYMAYLSRYMFSLESYLDKGAEEHHGVNPHNYTVTPLRYGSKLKIEDEILEVAYIIKSWKNYTGQSESQSPPIQALEISKVKFTLEEVGTILNIKQ